MGKIKVVRAVVDTNVIISALLFGGTPAKLIPCWKTGRLVPLASNDIVDEYLRVLAYPKFSLSEEEINYIFYQQILPYFEAVEIKRQPGRIIVKEDPADDMFIRCALAGKAALIVSGDFHLLALKSYRSIKILTPSQALQLL